MSGIGVVIGYVAGIITCVVCAMIALGLTKKDGSSFLPGEEQTRGSEEGEGEVEGNRGEGGREEGGGSMFRVEGEDEGDGEGRR